MSPCGRVRILPHKPYFLYLNLLFLLTKTEDTFHDLLYRATDEMDLPFLSASSGYESNPLVHSFYQRVYELNRCNRNDYQNLGVNGKKIIK